MPLVRKQETLLSRAKKQWQQQQLHAVADSQHQIMSLCSSSMQWLILNIKC
jgi:hypothetical protein